MSTAIAQKNPVEAKVVDYRPSESDKEEENPDSLILFRILLNGHKILDEFEDTTDGIFQIKKQFEDISTTLTLIDATKFASYKKVRVIYAPKWVPIYKSYLDLISKLQESAKNDISLINTYLTAVIPTLGNPKVSYGDKQVKLQSFIDNLEKTEKTAQSFGAEFTKMQAALNEFSSILRQFALDVGAGATDEMVKALKEIEKLEKKLNDLKDKCKVLFPNIDPLDVFGVVGVSSGLGHCATASIAAAALSKTSLAGAASCLASMSLVAPAAVLGILGLSGYKVNQVAQFTKGYSELIETTALLTAERAKLAALTAGTVQAKALDLSVATTIGSINDVIPRLGSFVNISPILKKDALEIRKFIELFKNDPEKLQEELQSQLKLISSTYGFLEALLNCFSIKTTSRSTGGSGDGNRKKDGFEDRDKDNSNKKDGADDRRRDKDPSKQPQIEIVPSAFRLFRALEDYLRSIRDFIYVVRNRRGINNEVLIPSPTDTWLQGVTPILTQIEARTEPGEVVTETHFSDFLRAYELHNIAYLQASNNQWLRAQGLLDRNESILAAGRELFQQMRSVRTRPGRFFHYEIPPRDNKK